ncbi:hypothetical protein PoB_004625100 [Plakobranchus ocellatus]|uniref:Secreted protein n=1 Tax=Plakobranchus ocellatus TaxID=259542 RepID=A0AAV4BH35_9GAST|nr:hypothetical protein PoB_004625100 [Plakobranchus ocellatus]
MCCYGASAAAAAGGGGGAAADDDDDDDDDDDVSPGLKRPSYPFSAGWTQKSSEKLSWPGLGFEPRTCDLVANCLTR